MIPSADPSDARPAGRDREGDTADPLLPRGRGTAALVHGYVDCRGAGRLVRLVCTELLAFPADAAACGLRLERVPAFGFARAFVFAAAGTFFDGLMATATPDRGAEPFALVLGAVATDPDFVLCVDRWPAATAAVEIASAATSPTMSRILFISVSFLETWVGGATPQASAARSHVPR